MWVVVGQTVSHYRILAKLGTGGMGVVYEAEDTRLHRRVAIKFLPEGAGPDRATLERFTREAEAASALQHPNICVIHDVGEHDGRPFIVMERLEGRTLRDVIGHKPLPVARVLELGAQLADALAAAHQAGIIHRDIKPTNIFVTARGDAKLLDFGLATLEAGHDRADPDAPTRALPDRLTEAGTTVGTVGYMSPEQARGARLDARSDVFSLGAVLWEMATGRAAFDGPTAASIFDAILHRDVQPPSRVNPDVPDGLDQAILGALEKDPDLRIQSAAELRAQLRRLIRGSGASRPVEPAAPAPAPPSTRFRRLRWGALVVVGAVAIAAGTWYLAAHRDMRAPAPASATAPAASPAPSIAVLPFVNVSADSNQQYFADGLSGELIDVLAKIPKLRVIGRTSSFQFKGRNGDLRTIGTALGVNHLLEGTVRKEGNEVRISAELVNVSDGSQVWSDSYDRTLDDVFKVQDEIATAVAQAMQGKLFSGLPARNTTTSGEAHNLILEARYFFRLRTRDGFAKAAEDYQKALAIDPDYADAWAGLTWTYANQAQNGYIPNSGFEQARQAAARAIALDPDLADAHVAMSIVDRWDWDLTATDRELDAALALDPRNPDALLRKASLAWIRGQFDDGMVLARRAIAADPLNVQAYNALALDYWASGRMADAEATVRKILTMSPDFALGHDLLGRALIGEGRPDAALAVMQQEPGEGGRLDGLVIVYWALGRKADSDAALAKLKKEPGNWSVIVAEAYAFRGNADEAFRWLDRAYAERDPLVIQIKGSRYFNGLHDDPRWKALLAKLKLPV